MMPVSASTSNHQDGTNYKKKYKNLKKKLHLLVYEQECFTEELKKCQRRLLKLSKDRSFLLDRLLQYEKVEETSSDSDATASSDSDNEAGKDGGSAKKKKTSSAGQMALMSASILGSPEYQSLIAAQSLTLLGQGSSTSSKTGEPPKKRAKVTKKAAKQAQNKTSPGSSSMPGPPGSPPIAGLLRPPPGHMTREELERHLELKQSSKPQFMAFENAPHSLPDDIFSHDNSNQDGELMTDTRRLHPK